jgi:hypothetical protein
MHIANILASRMKNGMIRAKPRACDVTDRLRHDRATVVKLCDMSNRQRLHLSSLLYPYNEIISRNCIF